MKQWQSKNGYKIFQVLTGRSNSYLITDGKVNVLVDTGKESAYDRLLKNIDSLGLTQKKISLLILTHTHYDHCQNAFRIREHDQCRILMGKKERRFAESGYTPLPDGTFLITRLISGIGKKIGRLKFGYHPFTPDLLVDNEMEWVQGSFRIKVIITDGHSDGSISVIVDDEIVIVGDEMMGVYKNSIFPPFADNTEMMIRNWGKLLNTKGNLFLPGHGKAITRELLQKEYTKYAQKHKLFVH